MPGSRNDRRPRWTIDLRMVVGALVGAVMVATMLYAFGWHSPAPTTRSPLVDQMDSSVMPPDPDRTTYLVQMTGQGGVQQVVARDSDDQTQITLIQQYVQHAALNIRFGNFEEFVAQYGQNMPGLAALESGFRELRVEYQPLPNGAQLTFTTPEAHLVTAVHQWLGAQRTASPCREPSGCP